MADPFDQKAHDLPSDDDYSRLRVMVCDPGTVYLYWQAGAWRGEGWRLRVVANNTELVNHTLTAEMREYWFETPPDCKGVVILETLRDGKYVVVAEAGFVTPPDGPRAPAREPRFARPSGGAPGVETGGDAPEIEDVFAEARLYHGKVWRPTEAGDTK